MYVIMKINGKNEEGLGRGKEKDGLAPLFLATSLLISHTIAPFSDQMHSTILKKNKRVLAVYFTTLVILIVMVYILVFLMQELPLTSHLSIFLNSRKLGSTRLVTLAHKFSVV